MLESETLTKIEMAKLRQTMQIMDIHQAITRQVQVSQRFPTSR